VSLARASDRWVFQRLGVGARAEYDAADVAARGDVVRGSAGIYAQFRLAIIKLNFLQGFKQKCSEL
jgi:hypothetical protein